MERELLIDELEHLFRIIMRKSKHELNQLFNGELTVAEFSVLKLLDEYGPLKISDIAQQFQVSLSHITFLSEKMIKKELIHRSRSEVDRRVVKLSLSTIGKETQQRLEKTKREYLLSTIGRISDEELKQLVQIYKKLK